MYSLVRSTTFPRLLTEQLPALALALIIAELWFKFGSFTLECLGFLATWFVLDYAMGQLRKRLLSRRQE